MELNPGASVHGFSIKVREDLPEIEGEAIVGVHEQSGARLLYLKNDDNNKSFAIGFKTPPKDDTGVFHILEHSVLCGSRRFPVKEPFVDLLKSSMQTFLNAMTFDDKTLYPVASTNEQDLYNLMDVYLDAVFHPRIYEKRAIFEQEGWHHELIATGETEGGNPTELPPSQTQLVYNGVVYNEMKGALSDSGAVLYDELKKALFPDTCYAFESGGTPQSIPTLTYEEYLDEHRRHYRTDNSYIILYGNLDAQRALAFLDERYLAPVAAEQAQADRERIEAGLEPLRPRETTCQPPRQAGYASKTMDTAAENAVAACGYVIGDASDRIRAMATDILLDALFGSNEAPLKRALLDDGVAHDVTAYVSDALAQPFAIVQVNMPAEGVGEHLAQTVETKVRELLDAGLDLELVEAALSHEEFVLREHELGYADGVVNSIMALSSWLYDDDAPIDYLRYEQAFSQLRDEMGNGYFERLCKELFLENDHTAQVEIVPTPGVSDDDSAERLAKLNEELTAGERARIVEEEAVLREMQEAPDSPEDVATLPRLRLSDIDEAPADQPYAFDADAPIACLRHSVPTRGIAYAYRYFDLSHMAFEDLPYVSILSSVLGKLDTADHTAAEIDTLMQGKLGNLTVFTEIFENDSDPFAPLPKLVVSSSALSENVEWLARLPREVIERTDYTNTAKILDVLKQRKIAIEQSFSGSGHSCAAARCKSYFAASGVLHEKMGNVGFYQFLCALLDEYEARAEDLAAKLADVAARVFRDDVCIMSFAGSDEDLERFWEEDGRCKAPVQGETPDKRLVVPAPVIRNEAFIVPSDVCFAAVGWDRRLLGEQFDGSWSVAGRALSLDYLWNEVRVKGGAYGVGFQSLRSGSMRFYSYRDPHLDETLERFEQASAWLADYDPSQEEFEGFIVATVAKIDAPVKPRLLIRRQASDFFLKRSPEVRREVRRQVMATDREAVRAFAPVVAKAVEANAVCVFGNREILEASSRDFEVVTLVG